MSRQYGVFWPSGANISQVSGVRRHPRAPRGAYFEHLSNTSSTQVLDCSNTSSCQSNSRPYPGNPGLTLELSPWVGTYLLEVDETLDGSTTHCQTQ